MYEHGRTVWLRLNVDGVLLAVLTIASGLDLFSPNLNDIVREVGHVPPTFYVWTICYLVAGASMLAGFIGRSVGAELLGRLLMCFGFTLETFRLGTIYGFGHHDLIESYTIGAALFAISIVRAWVLLSKRQTHIVIGGRRHG